MYKYYQPISVVTYTTPKELFSFQAFKSMEDCEAWMQENLDNPTEYEIQEYVNNDIEDVTILDKDGDLVYTEFEVTDIDWDVDYDEDEVDEELPTEMLVSIPLGKVIGGDMLVNEYINDYLADTYGFCVNGYSTEPMPTIERYTAKNLKEILEFMASYVASNEVGNEGYFYELAKTGLFQDAMGKIVDTKGEVENLVVKVTTEY